MPTRKLTAERAREIKQLLADRKLKSFEIAKKFGVSGATITHIKQGRLWRHVSNDKLQPYVQTCPCCKGRGMIMEKPHIKPARRIKPARSPARDRLLEALVREHRTYG